MQDRTQAHTRQRCRSFFFKLAVIVIQEYAALSRAAMDMLREAGVEGAVSTDGLPSPNFPDTFYHPAGHVWDWRKDQLVTDPADADSAAGD